jgi:hypothetical protein
MQVVLETAIAWKNELHVSAENAQEWNNELQVLV